MLTYDQAVFTEGGPSGPTVWQPVGSWGTAVWAPPRHE